MQTLIILVFKEFSVDPQGAPLVDIYIYIYICIYKYLYLHRNCVRDLTGDPRGKVDYFGSISAPIRGPIWGPFPGPIWG